MSSPFVEMIMVRLFSNAHFLNDGYAVFNDCIVCVSEEWHSRYRCRGVCKEDLGGRCDTGGGDEVRFGLRNSLKTFKIDDISWAIFRISRCRVLEMYPDVSCDGDISPNLSVDDIQFLYMSVPNGIDEVAAEERFGKWVLGAASSVNRGEGLGDTSSVDGQILDRYSRFRQRLAHNPGFIYHPDRVRGTRRCPS